MLETRLLHLTNPRWRRGAVPFKSVAGSVAALLLLAGAGYLLLRGSAEDLLDQETLSPAEIRRVAKTLLVHDDLKLRARASMKLAEQGDPAVPVLKELGLSTSNSKLRFALFGVLAPMDADAAVEIAEAMMNDPDADVRQQAVRIAARLATPRAVAIMVKALEDPDVGIRSSAAGLMSASGATDAIPALEAALNDPELSVRNHAARALGDLTGQDYSAQVKPPEK